MDLLTFKQETSKMVIFVATKYATQRCLLIVFRATSESRKIWARRVIARLKLSPVFRDDIEIMKVTYSNSKVLELFIFLLIWLIICILVSVLSNQISVTSVLKQFVEGIFSFVLLVRYLIVFSMAKRTSIFLTEAFFNYLLLILRKLQYNKSMRILIDWIERMKTRLLNSLKLISRYQLFCCFLGFKFYAVRMKFFRRSFL